MFVLWGFVGEFVVLEDEAIGTGVGVVGSVPCEVIGEDCCGGGCGVLSLWWGISDGGGVLGCQWGHIVDEFLVEYVWVNCGLCVWL